MEGSRIYTSAGKPINIAGPGTPGRAAKGGHFPSAPRRKPVREIDGPTQPIPRDATGKVDAQRLNRGQVYEAVDGTRWRWNSRNFTEVL